MFKRCSWRIKYGPGGWGLVWVCFVFFLCEMKIFDYAEWIQRSHLVSSYWCFIKNSNYIWLLDIKDHKASMYEISSANPNKLLFYLINYLTKNECTLNFNNQCRRSIVSSKLLEFYSTKNYNVSSLSTWQHEHTIHVFTKYIKRKFICIVHQLIDPQRNKSVVCLCA